MLIQSTHKHLKAILLWYFAEYPIGIVRGYAAYARALIEIFPLPFLFLTLLSPWKNIRQKKAAHGFDLSEWFGRFVFNVFSRCVGAVVRIIAMILAVILQIVLLIVSVCYLLLWETFPAVSLTALVFLIRQL